MADTTNAQAETKVKPKISILGVQEDLANGLTREQIGQKYGISKAATSRLFKNEKLKGLKTKLPREEAFDIIDDAPERKPSAAAKKAAKTADGTEAVATGDGTAPVKTDGKGNW